MFVLERNCVIINIETINFIFKNIIFVQKMDSNKDGIVTFTEFKEYCVNVTGRRQLPR